MEENIFETVQKTVTTAKAEALWDVLSKVSDWPSWNPGCKGSALEGGLIDGAKGTVILPNGVVRPFTVWNAEPPTYLRYGTVDFGNEVSFTYRFDPAADGGTAVTIASSIRGWLSPVLGLVFGRVIAAYLPDELRQLVRAAEGGPLNIAVSAASSGPHHASA